MDTTSPPEATEELTTEDLDNLDTHLLQMDLLYKSRCVKMPTTSNVTVREIEDKD